ncbi:MAG: cation diffusion facilitator family transporter [Woeseiaceae bacterium]|nr:cation diffusion facilitator family transporter [Woeseiaceae bacterium]
MTSAAQGSAVRAILYAFLANGGIAIAKTWAAWLTGSGSMLAEAIHSYADTANQVLLFLGLKQSGKRPDEEHPLGYGKLTYFWSFIVAMLLFSVGGLFSIYEGLHKFQHPEPLNQVWVAFLILGIAIVLETLSLLGCLREIRKVRGERPFREWFRHTRNSELVVVLGEDIAALLGLCFALLFIGLAVATGNPVFDAIGSGCIGVVLVVVSIFLTIRMQSLLVGRSADPMVEQEIDRIIGSHGDIERVFNTITMQMGPYTLLAAKVEMKAGIGIESAIRAINDLEVRLKQRFPELKWCFMEPDVSD